MTANDNRRHGASRAAVNQFTNQRADDSPGEMHGQAAARDMRGRT